MLRFVGRVPLFAAVVLTGCSEMTGPQSQLIARLRWEAQELSTYQYVLRRICFCLGPDAPVIVTVVEGAVVNVVEQSSGAPVDIRGAWPTIDRLFAQIERAREDERLLEVEYHPRLGHPTRISICCLENDSGVTYEVSNVRPLGFVPH